MLTDVNCRANVKSETLLVVEKIFPSLVNVVAVLSCIVFKQIKLIKNLISFFVPGENVVSQTGFVIWVFGVQGYKCLVLYAAWL